jgi:hypothetical protein
MHPNHQHSSPMLGSGSLSFMSGLLLLAGIGTDEYMSNILAMCGEFVEKYPVLNYTLSNAGNHVQDALSLIDADGLEKVYRWNLGLTGGMLQVSLAALADVFEVSALLLALTRISGVADVTSQLCRFSMPATTPLSLSQTRWLRI